MYSASFCKPVNHLVMQGAEFHQVFGKFLQIFRKKTGKMWESRTSTEQVDHSDLGLIQEIPGEGKPLHGKQLSNDRPFFYMAPRVHSSGRVPSIPVKADQGMKS